MERSVLRCFAGAITLLLVGACATSPARDAATFPQYVEDPGESGFSKQGLDNIQTFMDSAVQEGRIPSAIAMIARDGKIVWLGTAGEMGQGVPMRTDAIIPLASVGKMYTATAAMILYDRGLISLDDPVARFIPEFSDVMVSVTDEDGETRLVKPDRPITIQHILTHTAGLKVSGDDFWATRAAHVEKTNTTELSRALAKLPLQSQPGTRFEYGVTGESYNVLAAVIETVSGQTLEAFMFENIFDPLGLENTFFYIPDEKAAQMPAFYRKSDDGLKLERGFGEDFPRTTFFHGGGGVRSAPEDILRFTQIFLNRGASSGVRILEPESVESMMSDQLGEMSPFGDPDMSWGFGAAVRITQRLSGQGTLYQYGWVGGNYAMCWIDPIRNIIGYNAFPVVPPGDIALLMQYQQLVYGAVRSEK